MHENTKPRLLLVEDDAVSRVFLHEALSELPANVDVAEDIATAMAMASRHQHALWLVDANLPDGNGRDCLRQLRCVQPATPALAITAEAHRDGFDALCQAGFVEVLQKPITIVALQANVRRVLGLSFPITATLPDEKLPAWEQDHALAAVAGNRATLAILRQLFLSELPKQRVLILAACERHDAAAARTELHKLMASCGFVGASRLLSHVQQLSDMPTDSHRMVSFDHAVNDTLAAQS